MENEINGGGESPFLLEDLEFLVDPDCYKTDECIFPCKNDYCILFLSLSCYFCSCQTSQRKLKERDNTVSP